MKKLQSEIWKELVEKRFGRLIVEEVIDSKGSLEWFGAMVKCRCDCGNQKLVGRRYLTRGQSKSCGCLNKQRNSFYHCNAN